MIHNIRIQTYNNDEISHNNESKSTIMIHNNESKSTIMIHNNESKSTIMMKSLITTNPNVKKETEPPP